MNYYEISFSSFYHTAYQYPLGRPTMLYSRNRTTTMYVQMLPWLHYGLSLCLEPYREVSNKCDCRREYFSLGTFPYFQQIAHFTGYELEVCRSPIYFMAVGFLESLPVADAVYFVCLSRTVPKQYRLSIVVVG